MFTNVAYFLLQISDILLRWISESNNIQNVLKVLRKCINPFAKMGVLLHTSHNSFTLSPNVCRMDGILGGSFFNTTHLSWPLKDVHSQDSLHLPPFPSLEFQTCYKQKYQLNILRLLIILYLKGYTTQPDGFYHLVQKYSWSTMVTFNNVLSYHSPDQISEKNICYSQHQVQFVHYDFINGYVEQRRVDTSFFICRIIVAQVH